MPKLIDPETAYDLQRFTDEAIVKGPLRLSPLTGEAFLRILEAVKGESAAPAADDKVAKELAAKVATLEAELAEAKAASPNVDAIEAPLTFRISTLESELAAAIQSRTEAAAELETASKARAALEQEATDQGNIIRALEEKAATLEAAAKADAEKITTLEAKVKALAAV